MKRPWRSDASWLVPHGLFNQLPYSKLRSSTTHSELGSPTSTTKQDNAVTSHPVEGEFSQLRFSLEN